jgi:hypothetical protein
MKELERVFCIAGPIDPERHYFIPQRLDWVDLHRLIKNCEYFVLHAPRQSGKTTAIKEFCNELSREGVYTALYINVEPAQAIREEVEKGLLAILRILLQSIRNQCPQENILEFIEKKLAAGLQFIDVYVLNETLEYIAQHSAKPVVLFIDEIDSLIGDTLLSVLRQIQAGFDKRPALYPHALCLIGLRDVRDYRVWSRGEGKKVSTSSPFNIKSKSLIISNFTLEDVKALYQQHTLETGQEFSPEAIEYVYYLTAGQPWLVNALAYQTCYEDVKDRQRPISKDDIGRAKETLIKRCDTHIDSLIDKLREDRVRPIMEAIITGETDPGNIQPDDLQYLRDLGLIRQDRVEIANPIYREIIPRELTSVATELITQTITPFKKADGALDTSSLIKAFIDFYRENSAIWLEKFDYKEAGPHLLMMAFLQRVINGGGTLHREYALGKGRVDILLRWGVQTIVIELKIFHRPSTLTDGLDQTASYMDSSSAGEGHLILFDRRPHKSWDEKNFHLTETCNNKIIQVWGC